MRYATLILMISVLVSGCTAVAPHRNNRPPIPFSDAHHLVDKCQTAVRFNIYESTVPESDYLNIANCLGIMIGILGTNTYLTVYRTPLFCPPGGGVKTWIAAETVVKFAKARPDLLDLTSTVFAIRALAHAYPCQRTNRSPPLVPRAVAGFP